MKHTVFVIITVFVNSFGIFILLYLFIAYCCYRREELQYRTHYQQQIHPTTDITPPPVVANVVPIYIATNNREEEKTEIMTGRTTSTQQTEVCAEIV